MSLHFLPDNPVPGLSHATLDPVPSVPWLTLSLSLPCPDPAFEDSDKFHTPARPLQGLAYS